MASAAEAKTRNKIIVERIRMGEKRYMLAEEFGLCLYTITRISAGAGLARWQRFKRVKN